MDLKKFKNFTKSNDKIDKIEFYGVNKYFEYLKVIEVLNYFTVKVVIYNRDKLNKWIFKLQDVDILDDKLTPQNKEFLKKRLEQFTLGKYMKFKINRYSLNQLEGSIQFEDKMKSSVNTSMVNITINLSVMRKKIKMFEKKEMKHEELFNMDKNPNLNYAPTSGTRLCTIYEGNEH